MNKAVEANTADRCCGCLMYSWTDSPDDGDDDDTIEEVTSPVANWAIDRNGVVSAVVVRGRNAVSCRSMDAGVKAAHDGNSIVTPNSVMTVATTRMARVVVVDIMVLLGPKDKGGLCRRAMVVQE